MKHLKTFGQLNELKSLDSYDANTFISNKLIEFLNKLLKLLVADDGTIISDDSTEREITYKATKVIIDSIIEFYDIEDNLQNRKKINSLFYVSTSIDTSSIGSDDDNPLTALWENLFHIYIHINNKESNIYVKGSRSKKAQIFEDRIVERISKLIDELKKKYPEWVERTEFKKSEILPYVKTKFQGDDFAKRIYDWNTTFETLEKLFHEYSFDNLEDADYEKYFGIIDRNLDKLKEYVEKNDYKTYIGYEKMYPNIVFKTLEQSMIYDKKYFSEYINSLRDIGISKKLFDKDFIEFLDKFKKFISK
jgi:hypothetical protein